MSHCERCDNDVWPSQELQPSGAVKDVCPHCGSIVASASVPPPAAPLSIKAPASSASPPPAYELDAVDLARAQLTEIETKVADYQTLLARAARLRRLIAAADGEREAEPTSGAT